MSMTVNMDKVLVPNKLTDRQVKLAKDFVRKRKETDITISGFCTSHNISTDTWYKWREDFRFQGYLNDLQGSVISDDEKQAFSEVKRKIMELATNEKATVNEIKLFLDTFSYVVEADKHEAMRKLGLTKDGSDAQTMQERQNTLLSRLQPSTPNTEKGK